MSSRLDRLLLLLDTGSSTSVRTTAAKQLAQLAAKSVISDVAIEEDVKAHRPHLPLGDISGWQELMSVIARILPNLHSKSHETRSAAAVALQHIFTLVPLWHPCQNCDEDDPDWTKVPAAQPEAEFPQFSVQELIQKGTLLLASSGKEFAKRSFSSPEEVKKASNEAMRGLGLDFMVSLGADDDGMDIEDELAADAGPDTDPHSNNGAAKEEEMYLDSPLTPVGESASSFNLKKEASPLTASPSTTPTRRSPIPPATSSAALQPGTSASPPAETIPASLSAREMNRLKRKRKQGNSAFVPAPPPPAAGAKVQAMATGPGNKARLIAADDHPKPQSRSDSPQNAHAGPSAEKVVVDPMKGGAVSPKTAGSQSKALEVHPGQWIWDGLVKVLEVDIFSPAWEVRHGAAMALRELLKAQGKYGGTKAGLKREENAITHERWCNHLAAKLLCVFCLDRFGDYVSDQVIAPVRETVSQTLASLLLHMPKRSVLHVHAVLLQMIRQDFTITLQSPPPPPPKGRRGAQQKEKGKEKGHVWEVRHAGLLGIKYEVAVRSDVVEDSLMKQGAEDVKMEEADTAGLPSGKEVLQGVVDAAVLGLGDRDDDVRSVAANCLLPVATHLVRQLPERLSLVLAVLWSCLSDMKDDLSSSVGAVMDLLGKLVSYEEVISVLANESSSRPLTQLAPTLFPFFRHTIPTVRLAVVETLHSFMNVPTLPKDWVSTPFLRLLFQNLIVEERQDIRDSTVAMWRTSIGLLHMNQGLLETTVDQTLLYDWFGIMMTPLGTPLNPASFYNPVVDGADLDSTERHNVDRNMIAGDLILVSQDTIWKARIASASALAFIMAHWGPTIQDVDEAFSTILLHYIGSTSMLQAVLAAIIAEEWALQHSAMAPPSSPLLIEFSPLARELSHRTLAWLQAPPPATYHEMLPLFARIHTECNGLMTSFVTDCKVSKSSLPLMSPDYDATGMKEGSFSLEDARAIVGREFTRLKDSLGRTKKRELAHLADKRKSVEASINRYEEIKEQNDVRVAAAFAAAFVALKTTPDKVTPLVKGVMNGIKGEENVDLQTRSAVAVAAFVEFCALHSLSQPPAKIVTNLCTFLCQDTQQTPPFVAMRKHLSGILSFQTKTADEAAKIETGQAGGLSAKLSRRGAGIAFKELSAKFGPELLTTIPKMWQAMAGGILSACETDSPEKMDNLIEKQFGQDVIDSLSVLEAVVPTLHQELWPQLRELFPLIIMALRSRFAIIRQAVARCFATICDVMTVDAMRHVIEVVLPFLGDTMNLANRQGATELVYNIVQKLNDKALPYVIFLIVPVLGRMSDPDDDIRSTATNTFAALVKMVPLEAGLPSPPEFSEELLKRRDEERQFLTQLLDGSKVEPYQIPVHVEAELRPYQQDGVNWLAFLAKYQLHGILCDDMGLGKTLQSICILASKHHERNERYKQTKSPDSVHVPSLIVCPPTLTGHWFYEIQKYVNNLKPIMYTGNARERNRMLPKLKNHDVVITSYEVVRNDINTLQEMNWHYCILDEGHIIKNAKTKLTKAVKSIRAHHRLILSGTPIQNNVLELWSLFDFLMPGFLGSETFFNERYSKPILSNRDGKSKNSEAAALALEALHKQVLPFVLRRLKEDVLHDLPPKIIQDYFCELSDVQKQLYDDFSQSKARVEAEDAIKSSSAVAKSGKSGEKQHIFQSLQYLRKLCNHPALVVKGDVDAFNSALTKIGHKPESTSVSDIQHAPKLLALRQLLVDCGIGGSPAGVAEVTKSELADAESSASGAFSQHRVLIFCQMKQMLDIIESDLFKKYMPSVTYMRLDGNTDSKKRHAIVQTFNADPSIDCLLLTTQVGGLGLTLTGADTVIFVEHDWNPMKDLQAMDRAHRIGQKKVVNVYRLITKGTLEEKIMGLQRFKLNIANSVVTQQNSGLSSMDTDHVLDLFNHSSTNEAPKKEKEGGEGISKNILDGLEDLPGEEEYQDLDMSSFMGSLGR